MAKVTFLSFYNNFAVGVNILSSLLVEAGHDVSLIFFKLPYYSKIEWFSEKPINIETVNAYGDISGSNSEVNRWNEREIELLGDLILRLNTEILCISSRSPDNELVIEVLPQIRKRFKGKMIAGGFGPTFDPETYADIVDYVFIGEAENSIVDLISKLDAGKSIDDMDNICYKRNGNVIKNKLAVPDISRFKTQLIHEKTYYIENNRVYDYGEREEILSTHAYYTFVGRGCLKACTYCSAGNWFKIYKKENINVKPRRIRPVEDIIDELKAVKDPDCTFILFRDSFLTGPTEYLKSFFKLYERHIALPFWAYFAPRQMINNPDILKMAVDAGFVDTEIGIQSGSERINKTIFKRTISLDDTIKYAEMLAEYDINVRYDIIIFNPAETEDDVKETFKTIQRLPKKRAYLELARLKCFPGLPIYDILSEYHEVQIDFEHQYRTALLYLLCFVLPEAEFEELLKNRLLISSMQDLRSYYKEYLKMHDISFPIGTHTVPASITTSRYDRIIKRYNYEHIVVWKEDSYFEQMKHIFEGVKFTDIIDENISNNPSIFKKLNADTPLFVCSARKQEIKRRILAEFPNYKGKIYV
jgi:radical SAM superfamily enzyme YgiQ (UPF0313 family)